MKDKLHLEIDNLALEFIINDVAKKRLHKIVDELDKKLQCKHIDVNYFCSECTEGFTNAEVANALHLDWAGTLVVDGDGNVLDGQSFPDWLENSDEQT